MPRPLLAALCALLALPAPPAGAGDFVAGGDSGALARSFALPALGDAAVLTRGRREARLLLDFTNEFVREGSCGGECIVLDGETARLRLTHRRGFGRGWDFSIDIPLLSQSGGFLDGWIQDWHGWFGLPNGGREQAVDDRYEYRYERNNAVLLSRTEGDSDLGDVTLGLGRRLGDGAALRGMAKLPTGDGQSLSGGNAGAALWLDLALPVPRGWDGFVAGGVSVNERGDVLPDMQNREVVFGGIGLLAPITRAVRLHLQVQGHTRLYDGSELSPLSRFGLPLTLGLQFRTGPRGFFDLGFQEDLSVNGSADFAAYLAVTSR